MLGATPLDYDRSVYMKENGEFDNRATLKSSGALSLQQNLVLTGGVFDITSDLSRVRFLDKDSTEFASTPISIGFTQSLNGYNKFKWESRIAPLKFEQAKKEYLQSLESLSIQAVNSFFEVVSAEINIEIAKTNYFNADTLYRIGRGRFEIGTVTQDELLDLELGLLNAELAKSRASIDLRQSYATLNSFLGLPDNVQINCIAPSKVPLFKIEADKALSMAMENNPDVIDFKRRLLESRENVAKVRSESGLSANIEGTLGINRRALELPAAYESPYGETQQISVMVSAPIIDWGLRKGKIQMARSNYEVAEATIRQAKIDFEQEVLINILDFNLQEMQVGIAAKADTIAQMGYEVTKQRFMIDKVDVIRLNSARNSLDSAKRSYIAALRRYWVSYYGVRELTLYDFLNNKPLMEDLDQLLQK
jgi:outer membrane protein TolC